MPKPATISSSGVIDTIEPELIGPESIPVSVAPFSVGDSTLDERHVVENKPFSAAPLASLAPLAPMGPFTRTSQLPAVQVPVPIVSPITTPPRPVSSPPPPQNPVDFENALAQLQRQRDAGAPAPPPPPSSGRAMGSPDTRRFGGEDVPSPMGVAARPKAPSVPSVRDLGKDVKPQANPFQTDHHTEVLGSPAVVPSTKSITAPHGTPAVNPANPYGLKPGSGAPLAPPRTPSPMAIVGGSLRINSPDKAIPVAGAAPLRINAPDKAMPAPSPSSRPSLLQDLANASLSKPPPAASVPPASPSSSPAVGRPPTAPRSFAPAAGGPPVQYERAFRQWSSPAIHEEPIPAEGVSFQVYTAQDVAQGRRPMRSIVPIEEPPKKSQLAVRIGLSLVGALVVALTAAAVIAVSTEDPKGPAPSATFPEPPPSVSATPEPPPSTISIGDPIDEPAPTNAAAPSTPLPLPKAATPRPISKPAATPVAPSGLKGVAPPPNPYGK